MTTKFKILSSIAFIALAIVLTFVGVWALADLDFTVGGNITYTAPEPSVELYRDETDTYWYVKMGSTADVSEIRWRLVGLNGERYTSSTKPTSGTGAFILETYVAKYKEFESAGSYNDYSISTVREYLKGDYLTELNLTNDVTYKAITPRSITDLHIDIGWATGNIGGGQQYAPPAGTTQNAPYDTIPGDATGSDSLWLMSVKEIYTLVGGGTLTNGTIPSDWSTYYDNLIWNEEYYWLRSPRPGSRSSAFLVNASGRCSNDLLEEVYALRPAFNLEF